MKNAVAFFNNMAQTCGEVNTRRVVPMCATAGVY